MYMYITQIKFVIVDEGTQGKYHPLEAVFQCYISSNSMAYLDICSESII